MKLRAKITGDKVHEVGYRVSLLEMAQDLGLSGFEAQNRKEDGCQVVLIFMEGDEIRLPNSRDSSRRKDLMAQMSLPSPLRITRAV